MHNRYIKRPVVPVIPSCDTFMTGQSESSLEGAVTWLCCENIYLVNTTMNNTSLTLNYIVLGIEFAFSVNQKTAGNLPWYAGTSVPSDLPPIEPNTMINNGSSLFM